ncbi:putative multidrug resistance protein [Dichanthelium oligosanthes]|uniref:Putative multidrug resistance protein n=1 Tax=Dichanthelium oligosanthes TaxID=888268 RepID=A0A1E5UKX8_9POAL|nr:putative multidrug resistance protein [Dichanthelium oligosanthes]
MALGLIGAIGDGISTPLRLLIACRIANDLGSGPDALQQFTARINANVINIVFLACASWVMAFLEDYCWERTAERQASRMRARYLRAVLRQDVEYFDLRAGSASEVVTSVSNDCIVVQDALGDKVPNFLMNVATFAGSYAVRFALLWRLTLVSLPSVLLLVIPGFTYSRVITGLARRIREHRLVMYHGYQGGTVFIIASLVIIGGVSLGSALSNVKYLSEAMAAAERILEMIRRVPTIDSDSKAGEELASVAGTVEFKNVEFCYPSRPKNPVFSCFNVHVPAGRTVALVGGSGSGKSTVIALLERFYDPSAGEVTLDGVDIRRLRLRWLRAQMGLVSQEPALFATTIRENILFGKEDATDEEVIAAAKAANAHNFISQLPQGYDTEKQRIAIARAILKSPKILLLDEATSALNTESERIVQEALDMASMGRTAIVVAHRLSNIRNADTIAVMQYGAILEQGSHSELIAKNGHYSSLVHLQQTRDDSSEGSQVSGSFHTSPTAAQRNSNTSKLPSSVSRSSSPLSMSDDEGGGDGAEKPKLPVPSFRRERMLAKILTFEIGWFDHADNSSGAICSQLSKDANIVRSLVGDRMALVIQTVSVVLIAFIMALAIAWRLALVMLAMQPFIIACFYTRRVLLKSMSMKSMQAQSETSKLASDAVSNLRTIAAFSSQDRILHLFGQAQDGPHKESIRQSWFAGFGLGTSVSLMIFSWAINFWYGAKLMAERRITAEAVFQTTMILVTTGRVIADACSMTTDLAKGGDAVASVFAIFDRETNIEPDNPQGYKPEKLTGEVEIIGVDFAYPLRPDAIIFKGFSLDIIPGKSTALVGHSGSGKSTIIGLIERFYDPLRGVVNIDGRDIKTYNLRALRGHIGLVSQEPPLFSGTIRENIMYGAEMASEAEVEDAARSANAHDFISNLKDGYNTWCGDRGVNLSGGQKQRIAIARAILKNPAIMLLDEATSALDSASEKAVREALDRMMAGRTSVVVAHRLSTIRA